MDGTRTLTSQTGHVTPLRADDGRPSKSDALETAPPAAGCAQQTLYPSPAAAACGHATHACTVHAKPKVKAEGAAAAHAATTLPSGLTPTTTFDCGCELSAFILMYCRNSAADQPRWLRNLAYMVARALCSRCSAFAFASPSMTARSRAASALTSTTLASVSDCIRSTSLTTRVTSSWYDLVTRSCSCSWMPMIVFSYDVWKTTARSCSSVTSTLPFSQSEFLTARSIALSTAARSLQKARGVNSCATLVTACCAKRMSLSSQFIVKVL